MHAAGADWLTSCTLSDALHDIHCIIASHDLCPAPPHTTAAAADAHARAVTRSRLREALTKHSEEIKAATAAIVAANGGTGTGTAGAGSSGASAAAPPLAAGGAMSLREAVGAQSAAFLST